MPIRAKFGIQLVGGLANTALFVILTPVLVASVGLDRYGLLLLVLSISIYAGLAELGLGLATSREMAAVHPAQRGSILGTALILNLVFSVLAGGIYALFSWAPVSTLLLSGDQMLSKEIMSSGWSLFCLGSTTVLAAATQGALLGLSRFVEGNAINLATTAAALAFPAAYAGLFGSDISGLIFSVAVGRAIFGIVSIFYCCVFVVRPVFAIDVLIARRLLKFGWWSTTSAIIHRVTNSIDRFLLGSITGTAAVAAYAVPQGALARSQILGSALMSAVFPQLAKDPQNDELVRVCYRVTMLLAPAFVAWILAVPLLLELWLGIEFAQAGTAVAILLGVWAWFEAVGYVPYVLLQAAARVHRETLISVTIFLPNLIALIVAIKVAGPEGAAFVAILRSLTFLILRAISAGVNAIPYPDVALHSACVMLAALVALGQHGWLGATIGAAILAVTATANFVRWISRYRSSMVKPRMKKVGFLR
jgi:O-antigen/teichoic acid export membrane protein